MYSDKYTNHYPQAAKIIWTYNKIRPLCKEMRRANNNFLMLWQKNGEGFYNPSKVRQVFLLQRRQSKIQAPSTLKVMRQITLVYLTFNKRVR